MADAPEHPQQHVFDNPIPSGGNSTYLVLGGFGLIALAAAGFVLALRTRSDPMSLHMMTTLPTIIGVSLIARGFSVRKLPARIAVDPDGLEVTAGGDTRRYPWGEIGSAACENVLNSTTSCLKVTDTAGRTLVRVDESFPGYRLLVDLVQAHVDAKPDDTSTRLMARKAKKTGLVCIGVGVLLGVGAVFLGLKAREDQRIHDLLARKGVPGEAELVRRFVAPDGVTTRIEYRVAGSELKNVEVQPIFWAALEDAGTVDVIYVPDEPDASRLASGAVEDSGFAESPTGGYLLAAACGLMSLVLLGFGPFAWKGYDLAFDDKTRVWKVKRYGRVIWASDNRGQPGEA